MTIVKQATINFRACQAGFGGLCITCGNVDNSVYAKLCSIFMHEYAKKFQKKVDSMKMLIVYGS